jgi:hypothetical protein
MKKEALNKNMPTIISGQVHREHYDNNYTQKTIEFVLA